MRGRGISRAADPSRRRDFFRLFALFSAIALISPKKAEEGERLSDPNLGLARSTWRKLDSCETAGTFEPMSVAELQKSIAALPTGPRRSIAKYVAYLQRRDAPARRRLLAAIGREMAGGKSYSQPEVDAALARRPTRR